MPLNFGRENLQRGSRPKRPPNYLSRSVQWKVFMMVACLMLVFILMQEAKKPDNWRWLWAFQDTETSLSDALTGEEVDTRLRMPPEAAGGVPGEVLLQGVGDPDRQATVPEPKAKPDDKSMGSTLAGQMTPVQRARHDAWTRLLDSLEKEQRTQFLRGLKAARDDADLAEEDQSAWPSIVAVLDSGWRDYLDGAFLAVSHDQGRLTDQEKRDWLMVIEQLESDWSDRVQPTLAAIGEGEILDSEQRRSLMALQDTLDRVFLDEIQDNTVFRPGEKDAWFRMFEQLDSQSEDQLRSASLGPVGYLQLYRQPVDYRGQLVTVQGEIRLGHYRQAPSNFYGIDGYYIFWLKPSGSNSPFVVYSLEVPERFPDVIAMERRGDKPELDEEVEFTGFFFKRWAYRAEDGTRLTPVLVAKSPRWQPPRQPTGQPAALPGASFWVLIVGGTLVFGVGVACYVYWMSRRSPIQAYSPRAREQESPGRGVDEKQEVYLDG